MVNVERNQLQNIELEKQNDIPEVPSFKARHDGSVSAYIIPRYTPASLHFTLHYITYLLTDLVTFSLTAWSTVLLEKLTGSQAVKKFPAVYGNRKFIITFTSAHHLSS